jgi:uncharacterized membrane protein
MGHFCSLAGFGVSLACAASVFAQGYSFTVLESTETDLISRGVMARGISGDGLVIAGSSALWNQSNGGRFERPYVWVREQTGNWLRRDLPMLGRTPPDPIFGDQAFGRPVVLSFDGDTIGGMVGPFAVANTWNPGSAGRWTQVLSSAPLVERLLPDDPYQFRSMVSGMSRDGQSFLITRQRLVDGAGSILRVGPLGNQTLDESTDPLARPLAHYIWGGTSMSGSGAVVGYQRNQYGEPHVWSNAAGVQQLARPASIPLNLRYGNAWAVSDDGRVVGGWMGSALNQPGTPEMSSQFVPRRPIIWRDGVPTVLPTQPPAFSWGRVTALNRDGQVVAGVLNSAFPTELSTAPMDASANRPVVWINGRLDRLDLLLTREGVDLQGVNPRWIVGLSHDGSTIAGWGTRTPPGSTVEHFVSFVATILPSGVCDDIDFNRDGNRFDPLDIEAFLSVFSEGPCLPAGANCRDIDFNNDGSLFDPEDVDAFLRVFSEGPCQA